MEKNSNEKFVKLVIESYAIRQEDGFEEFRATTRERAELELTWRRGRYGTFDLPYNSSITKERAIVECEVIRFRYPSSSHIPEKAGKTFYRVFHGYDQVIELDHEPKPLEVINAIAYDVDWKSI